MGSLVVVCDLVPKGVHHGGVGGGMTAKKSVSDILSYCFVCVFIISQYHNGTGNNISFKFGAAGAIFIFESEKHHGIQSLKTDTLIVSAFDTLIHVHDKTLPQSLICTEDISLYTVHIKLIITKFWLNNIFARNNIQHSIRLNKQKEKVFMHYIWLVMLHIWVICFKHMATWKRCRDMQKVW